MLAGKIAVALALLSLSAGCGDESAGVSSSSVGVIEDTDAVVGIVTSADQVTFYVCGGDKTYSTMTRWFSGPVSAGGAGGTTLSKGGWKVTAGAGFNRGALITPQGKSLPWSARPVVAGSAEGLYGAFDSGCRTGAVVTGSGRGADPRLQGTWCDGKRYAQVIPILPVVRVGDGIPVRIPLPEGAKDLIVQLLEEP